MGSIAIALCVLCASARAEPVEINGIELRVPAGWTTATKGKLTMLAPKAFKTRGIEVFAIPAMPEATTEAVQKLLGSEKITVTKVAPLERNGWKGVAVIGQVATTKMPVDMDMLVIPVEKGAVMVISFIQANQDPVLRKANTDVLLSARVAGPRITVTFTPPKKGAGIPKDFADAMAKMAPALDAMLFLPGPLPINIMSCGKINAFYSNATHSISLCHELWDDFITLFTTAGLDAAKAERVTRGVYLFTFFHEFGHALVFELGLPITGKGEDAADELATLVLAAIGAKGHEAALDAAFWFDTMVAKGSKNPFWDEHSFNDQRSVAITCLLYGADKTRYEPLMKTRKIPAPRLAKCVRDYGQRFAAWNKLLAPYHRKAKKIAAK
ncbi:MAG: DUF4344 domain-containing metallopeptidase [Polyangiales bacterium]